MLAVQIRTDKFNMIGLILTRFEAVSIVQHHNMLSHAWDFLHLTNRFQITLKNLKKSDFQSHKHEIADKKPHKSYIFNILICQECKLLLKQLYASSQT